MAGFTQCAPTQPQRHPSCLSLTLDTGAEKTIHSGSGVLCARSELQLEGRGPD